MQGNLSDLGTREIGILAEMLTALKNTGNSIFKNNAVVDWVFDANNGDVYFYDSENDIFYSEDNGKIYRVAKKDRPE